MRERTYVLVRAGPEDKRALVTWCLGLGYARRSNLAYRTEPEWRRRD